MPSYKVTIETESLDELYNLISNLKGKAEVTLANEAEQPKKKKEKKPVAEVVEDKEELPVVSNAVANIPLTGDEERGELSYEDVRTTTMALVKLKGKPAVVEILGQFKATSAQGLKPEQWADYVALVKLHLEEKAA